MATSDPDDPNERGWIREHWLAEKIRSGELPAVRDAALQECDRIFIEEGGTEAHAQALAVALAGSIDPGASTPADRTARLRAYLERLLLVRDMWSRERGPRSR